jgi:hypothetical protein
MHTVLAFMTLLKLYDASHNDGREYILLKYADLVSRISYLVSRISYLGTTTAASTSCSSTPISRFTSRISYLGEIHF